MIKSAPVPVAQHTVRSSALSIPKWARPRGSRDPNSLGLASSPPCLASSRRLASSPCLASLDLSSLCRASLCRASLRLQASRSQYLPR